MGNKQAYGVRSVFIALACVCAIACGDDDEPTDAGSDSEASESGRGGRGGTTAAGGRGGRGGTAGRGGTGGRGPTGGTGMMMVQCTEPAPTQPVVCGGQTCTAPTYEGNMCVIA